MSLKKNTKSHTSYYFRWILISSAIGVGCGTASAVFLVTLEYATRLREENTLLVYFLPIGGLLVGLFYHHFGKKVEGGNNLIIDEFHDPKSVIPFRMTPLILIGTVITHLFGGSAGREGTAVQMGGSIADQFTRWFKMNSEERRTVLMAGIAGGFASVFGVPLAGTFFGVEVLAIGRLNLWAIVECALAALAAHIVTLAWGIHHTDYIHPAVIGVTNSGAAIASLAGVIFGLTARLFSILTEGISKTSKSLIPYLPVRAFIGGLIIAILFFMIPETIRYAGLGVPIIEDSLKKEIPIYDWFGKLFFTTATLGTGFKGGEVTPLLFIGSALGNALGQFLPLSLPILACMGFVGVFAGAANTPFACTIMAMELFGTDIALYAALACFASYAVSGHRGIYHAQKIHFNKNNYTTRTLEFIQYLFVRPKSHTQSQKQRHEGES